MIPNITFFPHESPLKMNWGIEPIQYGNLFQAHKVGDIYVFFPGENIVMAGDVLSVGWRTTPFDHRVVSALAKVCCHRGLRFGGLSIARRSHRGMGYYAGLLRGVRQGDERSVAKSQTRNQ